MRSAAALIAVPDFPVRGVADDARPVDHAVERAEATIRQLDDCLHRASVGHVRVRTQGLTAQPLDSFAGAASCPGAPDQHEPRLVLRGEVVGDRHADLAEAAGNQVDAALTERWHALEAFAGFDLLAR